MQTQPVRSNNNRILVIMIAVLASFCLCTGIGVLLLGSTAFGTAFLFTGPAVGAGDAFMQALKEGDYIRAYALCSEPLQQKLESPQKLGQGIEESQIRPQTWKFTSRSVENDTARLEGSFLAGRSGELTLELIKVDGKWKVDLFEMTFP